MYIDIYLFIGKDRIPSLSHSLSLPLLSKRYVYIKDWKEIFINTLQPKTTRNTPTVKHRPDIQTWEREVLQG